MSVTPIILSIMLSAGAWLWLLRRYDRIEPEPLKSLVKVGFLGGFFSILTAAVLNTLFQSVSGIWIDHMLPSQALLFALFVGFNEETCKTVSTLKVTGSLKELDEPIDALIYSMTVALGFASMENIQYAFLFGPGVILQRSLLSVPAHLAFASIWGYGLAKVRFIYKNQSRFRVLFPYVTYAAASHAAFDFLLFLHTWTGILVFPLLFLLLGKARKRLLWIAGQTQFLQTAECPRCRSINDLKAETCRKCGTSLVQKFFRICPECRKKSALREDFCPECGTKFP